MNTWDEIKKLRGKTLRTLDQRKPFDVLDVSDHTVIIAPHKSHSERPISRDEVENAYRRLEAVGKLTRTEIRDNFSEINPAYVAAMLAELPNVKHSVRPIRLWIADK